MVTVADAMRLLREVDALKEEARMCFVIDKPLIWQASPVDIGQIMVDAGMRTQWRYVQQIEEWAKAGIKDLYADSLSQAYQRIAEIRDALRVTYPKAGI